MGRHSRLVQSLMLGLALAGCVQQGRPVVSTVTSRPAVSYPPVVTDPKVVESVAATLAALDPQAYGAVSMAEVGGTVLLTGAVVRPDLRRKVEQRIASVPGVTVVSNHILVTDGASLEGYRPDQSKEKEVSALVPPGLALRVVRGVVYLVGVALAEDVDRFKESVADDSAIQWVDASAVSLR